MEIGGIRTSLDMLSIAQTYNAEFRNDGRIEQALTACFFVVHSVDWYWLSDCKNKEAGIRKFKTELSEKYSFWQPILDFVNGAKHPKFATNDQKTSQRKSLSDNRKVKWEDPDFWDSWSSEDKSIFFIEVEGRNRSLVTSTDTLIGQLELEFQEIGVSSSLT